MAHLTYTVTALLQSNYRGLDVGKMLPRPLDERRQL